MTNPPHEASEQLDELYKIFARLHGYNYHEAYDERRWEKFFKQAHEDIKALIARTAEDARRDELEHQQRFMVALLRSNGEKLEITRKALLEVEPTDEVHVFTDPVNGNKQYMLMRLPTPGEVGGKKL